MDLSALQSLTRWITPADDNGISAIHHAAFAAHPGVVGFLLDKKASLHSRQVGPSRPMDMRRQLMSERCTQGLPRLDAHALCVL